MNKLSKSDIKLKDEIAAKLRDLGEKLKAAIATYNEKLEEIKAPVEDAVSAYNAAVQEWEEFRGGIADTQENHFDGKSENWQEGQRGQAYSEWKDQWAEEAEEVEVEFPEPLDEPDLALPDRIDGELLNEPEAP